MDVLKFGGASVKNADAVRNVGQILKEHDENLVVVISAMGKNTNLLETLVKAYFAQEDRMWDIFRRFREFHTTVCEMLFGPGGTPVEVSLLFEELEAKLNFSPSLDFNFEYDQIVCFGELVSTRIVSASLHASGIPHLWVDVRTCIRTDDLFRDASVDWELTTKLAREVFHFGDTGLYLTQGFIGSTPSNLTTTLGREGSDFSAAILGNVLDAERVTFWKDVPGVLSADPKKMEDARKIGMLSYREAVEMTHSGAKVIHPKTLKPLHNKRIPLFVKSFLSPLEEGTVIQAIDHKIELPPIYIVKENLVLITLSPKDFSFISIDDINQVIHFLDGKRVKVTLMQQSAIDLNLVLDAWEADFEWLMEKLEPHYRIRYNAGLTLITIRHYTEETLERMVKGRDIYLEQHNRLTARILVKK